MRFRTALCMCFLAIPLISVSAQQTSLYSSSLTSLLTKPLPNAGNGGPTNHLYSNGDAIADCALTDCGAINLLTGSAWNTVSEMQWATPGRNDLGLPVYHSSKSDPWYRLSCVSAPSLNGITFQAPNNAQFTQNNVSDEAIAIMDHVHGLILEGYVYAKPYYSLGNCSATSAQNACTVRTWTGCSVESIYDADWASNSNTFGGYPNNNANPTLISAVAGIVLQKEIMNGVISHALRLSYHCTNDHNRMVFPNTSNGGSSAQLCSSIGVSDTNRPPNGALIFLDYTDKQIANMQLPTWQNAIITAMAHYGGYLDATGPQSLTVGIGNLETGQAYAYRGTTDPFWAWIASQPGVRVAGPCSGNCSQYRYQVYPFANIPLVNGTPITAHIHMADPCVAIAQAGLTSYEGVAACN
ncbi:MAG TPA: hypothetical protein VKT29_02065 [Terriglobales bacterium]|nr:hypothetical protein [Terriglobales bacterium]